MKKLRCALGVILAVVAITASACSIHENYHGGPWYRHWPWHDRHR
jgi:hypothetical protein